VFGHPGLGQQTRIVQSTNPGPGVALLAVRSAHTSRPDQQPAPATPTRTPDWVADLKRGTRHAGRHHYDRSPLRPAAVLVLFCDSDTGHTVLLTERAADLTHYPQQLVFPGGAGATLPLVLLLLRSKLKRARTVAYATIAPSIFNANEPLMFGLPLVLNPYLCVPFVLVPLVLAVVTWETINLGLVARPAIYIPSTVPLPISVFLATKDWRSIVLVALNLMIGLAIYFPFVALYERHERSIGADT